MRRGFPIRISTDQSLLAAPHGFSQRATSFIASQCQGIHQMPFSCLIQDASCSHSRSSKTPSRAQGKTPAPRTSVPLRYGPFRTRADQGRQSSPQEDPPGSTVHFTSSHVQDPHPPEDERPAARPRVVKRGVDHGRETGNRFSRRRTKTSAPVPKDQNAQLVEANGIEPMTSCLQSTRSPN